MQSAVFTLLVCPTDSASYRLPLSVGECITGPDFDVLLTCEDGVWQPVLTAHTAVKLTELQLELALPEMPWDDALYFYSNVHFTNDIAYVRRWADEPAAFARDMFILKNKASGNLAALAMVTAHRFYSELRLGKNSLILYTDMEGKALVPGEQYRLERFVQLEDGEDETAFLSRYAATVAAINHARPLKKPPVGWCSWSRYYRNVNAENLNLAAVSTGEYLGKLGADTFQIDDGWQYDCTFSGKFIADAEKFPQGLDAVAQTARTAGLDFGLWLAPLIIAEESRYYEELKHLTADFISSAHPERHSRPFDPENEEFQKFLHEEFTALTKRYNVRYYKLDFLVFAWRNMLNGKRLYGKSDYMIALFRRSLQTIRDAVGPDVTLVACGSPILECVGIFDAARTTRDIISGAAGYWDIMQWVIKTVLYRWFYHNTVFTADPDGLILRDQDVGDTFDCTWAEAKLWATVVALSGGSMLVNEELSELSKARRSLVTALAPPLGVSARPVDLFETPVPTAAVAQYGEHRFVGQFHFDDAPDENHSFATADFGLEKALVIRSWDKKVLGVTENVIEKKRQPHSGELYDLRPVPEKPCFLYADGHIFGGVNLYKAHVENNTWVIDRTGDIELEGALYGWIPAGQSVVGIPVAEVPGGVVVKIREAKSQKEHKHTQPVAPEGFVVGAAPV